MIAPIFLRLHAQADIGRPHSRTVLEGFKGTIYLKLEARIGEFEVDSHPGRLDAELFATGRCLVQSCWYADVNLFTDFLAQYELHEP